jgi:hypothetical protein
MATKITESSAGWEWPKDSQRLKNHRRPHRSSSHRSRSPPGAGRAGNTEDQESVLVLGQSWLPVPAGSGYLPPAGSATLVGAVVSSTDAAAVFSLADMALVEAGLSDDSAILKIAFR